MESIACLNLCFVKCSDAKQGDIVKTGVLKEYEYCLQTRTAAGVRDVQSSVKSLRFIEQHALLFTSTLVYVSNSGCKLKASLDGTLGCGIYI